MINFDSFLYGNGLTIALLNKIKQISSNPIKKYLSCTNFITDFLIMPDHKTIYRDFLKLYKIDTENEKVHIVARNFLKEHLEEINKLGFERWTSYNLFSSKLKSSYLTYGYILYNYWYDVINRQILHRQNCRDLIHQDGGKILQSLRNSENIYTTNFENIMDQVLSPDHVHGRFTLPLKKSGDVFLTVDEKLKFKEYHYMYGTSGIEKGFRLNSIKEQNQTSYDLDFFFSENIHLGVLLIYGLAFGNSGILSEDFLKQYPEKNKSDNFLKIVDYHIVMRLEILMRKESLNKIIISYYSENDLNNYISVFQDSILKDIITYKQCSEIFPFI